MSWGRQGHRFSESGAWLFLTFINIKNNICELKLFLIFIVISSHKCGNSGIQIFSRVSGIYCDKTYPLLLAVKQCLSFASAPCAVSVSMSW